MALEIQQDERFQRRESRVERVGWGVLAVFVLAGGVGALGPGPLSWRADSGPEGVVTAEYDRVGHIEADDSLTLRLAPEAVVDGAVTVRFTGDWLEHVEIQGTSPQPAEETAVPGGLELEIPAAEGSAVALHIAFRAESVGRLQGTVEAAGDSVTFDQLILP